MTNQIIIHDNDKRMYERGLPVAHSSDGEGMPDVGTSLGLGNGAMLYLGERPDAPGWSLCIYRIDGPTIDIATGIDGGVGCDAMEAMDMLSAAINKGEADQ